MHNSHRTNYNWGWRMQSWEEFLIFKRLSPGYFRFQISCISSLIKILFHTPTYLALAWKERKQLSPAQITCCRNSKFNESLSHIISYFMSCFIPNTWLWLCSFVISTWIYNNFIKNAGGFSGLITMNMCDFKTCSLRDLTERIKTVQWKFEILVGWEKPFPNAFKHY